jgi:hypothetical protein
MEVVAALRAHLLAAQTHILMEVAVPVARDHQAVHPELAPRVGPPHPLAYRQIWRQLCPRTLPL